ncbi:hypothetical protein VIGAN_10088500 [Vigna angularis var. angularis]|uniref:Uncharacterized protein n=1 Tax=Vigna angularis var. angularis TaxID=157739 RepID=A0A0S3T3N1_PHAAN|nr:hypothetical protein VIGAN_10088500 [Vigna angularis var. angularis]
MNERRKRTEHSGSSSKLQCRQCKPVAPEVAVGDGEEDKDGERVKRAQFGKGFEHGLRLQSSFSTLCHRAWSTRWGAQCACFVVELGLHAEELDLHTRKLSLHVVEHGLLLRSPICF